VIATFRDAGLLNDGTAAVGFVGVLAALAGEQSGVLRASGALALSIGRGILNGVLVESQRYLQFELTQKNRDLRPGTLAD
jgi:NhaP-type Na+/H+ or K+/H+ antiporter